MFLHSWWKSNQTKRTLSCDGSLRVTRGNSPLFQTRALELAADQKLVLFPVDQIHHQHAAVTPAKHVEVSPQAFRVLCVT